MSRTDAQLRHFFDHGRVHDRDAAALWTTLERATEGGKRFRPRLLLAVHDALGGGAPAAAQAVGAAVELLHTAFVIHDDVIDGDRVRRGRPNVSGTFEALARSDGATAARAARYGDAAGILAGDLALAGAVRLVARCGAPPATVADLLDLFDDALRLSAAGELADVRWSLGTGAPDLATILTMEEHKTAVYSFVLPLRAGALLAGADDVTGERLAEVGRLLGIAFQLRDDLDGVFGDEAVTGKSVLSDLREGKSTPLVAHARTTPWWDRIAPYLGDPDLGEHDAARVRALLEECGSRRFIEDLAADYGETALEAAEALGLGAALAPWLAVTSERSVA